MPPPLGFVFGVFFLSLFFFGGGGLKPLDILGKNSVSLAVAFNGSKQNTTSSSWSVVIILLNHLFSMMSFPMSTKVTNIKRTTKDPTRSHSSAAAEEKKSQSRGPLRLLSTLATVRHRAF